MRLIDADALLTKKFITDDIDSYDTIPVDEIVDAPTIDAVEVVRCRDCMHYNHAVIDDDPAETFEVDVCLHKDLFPTRVTPDFYCAHGERKMNGEHNDIQRV